jgi:hypothetical protein
MTSAEAGIAWNLELGRRQDRHAREVRRIIQQHAHVRLAYDGPDRSIGGDVDSARVCIQVEAGWKQWVPLLQIAAINGVEPTTLKLMEKIPVDGVREVKLADGSSRRS